MPTLNATVFPTEAYVLVEVDWNDFPTVTHARVTRHNTVTGETVILRPYIAYDDEGNLLLNCGEGIWWDTEPPLNVPLEYCTLAADVPVTLNQNFDFETGVLPWTATGGTLTQSALNPHAGTFSGLLTPTGSTSFPTVDHNDDFALVGGVEAVMSAWVLSPQGWNGVRLIATVKMSDNVVETFTSPVEIVDDNEYRFLRLAFTPRLNATVTQFTFQVMGLPPGTTVFHIDEVQIVQEQAVSSTPTCETVTVTNSSIWLKSPHNPCHDVEIGLCNPIMGDCTDDDRISYVGMAEEIYDPNTVLLNPVNRRRPIPVNRIRRDLTSVLRLFAHSCDARDALLLINEPGDPLLFQAPTDYCIPDRYMSVGTVGDAHPSVDQREDSRLITMPHAKIDRPEGPANGPCGLRIIDMCDIYASWDAMTIGGLVWKDLLLGDASLNSPGDPPITGLRTWDEVETEFVNWTAVTGGGARDWNELRDGL